MQDRPFVPVSTIVLDGAPRDMRAVFRNWKDKAEGHVQTEKLINGKPARKAGGGMKVVGLAAALAALQQ
jgi:hypothetical protein